MPIVVDVYSDADEVELFLNGEGLGRKPAGKAADFAAVYELKYAPDTIKTVAYKNGEFAGEESLETAAPASRLQAVADKTEAPADGQSLVDVETATADDAGRLNMSVPAKVEIEVEGEAVLYVLRSDSPTGPFEVYSGRLTPDLKAAACEPVVLISANEAPWAKPVPFAKAEFGMDGDVYFTDGPCVMKLESGKLYMTWSSWSNFGYAVGMAVSESGLVADPWKQIDPPLFPVNGGHGMFFTDKEGKLRLEKE